MALHAAARHEGRAAAKLRISGVEPAREDLPDAVDLTVVPGAVGDEVEVEQAVERLVEVGSLHAQGQGHRLAPVEGRAGAVGREREQRERSDTLRSEEAEPPLVQEAGVEPAEAAGWAADVLRSRRLGRLALHRLAPFLRVARSRVFSSLRSFASLRR